MRITFTNSLYKSLITAGPFTFGFDLNQIPETLTTLNSALTLFNIIPEDELETWEELQLKLAEWIKELKACIIIEGEPLLDQVSIVHFDIDPQTLITRCHAEQVIEPNKDLVIQLDIIRLYRLLEKIKKYADKSQINTASNGMAN